MSKKRWSIPTWMFFHGIAEKVDETYYKNNYKDIFDIIRTICQNLPCPYCREHATSYCKTLTDNKINTKEKLKNELFIFHNYVNKRLDKKIFNESILNKYKTINIFKCFKWFDKHFYANYVVNHDFQGWKRNRVKEKINKYFNSHWKRMFNVK